jgi:hypothetical protein
MIILSFFIKPPKAQLQGAPAVKPALQSPILQPTLQPQPETLQLTDEEMMKALPHGELLWMTYGHESTWGKFDGCKKKGLYNGFGYAQNDHVWLCFESLEEAAMKVSAWFDKHLQTMTVRQALCYYNKGIVMDDCDYAEYSLNL